MATGIYKRSCIYWIRYTGPDGKQRRESSHSEKFDVAKSLLIDREKSIERGDVIEKIPDKTFRELSEHYLDWIKGRQKSARTKGYLIGQLLSVFGDTQLKRFTTASVDQLQTDLINKGYKPASNNKILNVLKHAFNKALEWNWIAEDTLKRIRKVKPLKDTGKRLRYLSKEDCQTLVNACQGLTRAIVITALNTGMRKGEILSLKWEQVDLKNNRILLDRTKNGKRRELPINNTLKETLQGLTRRLDIPYMFFDAVTGKPIKDVKRSFQTALKRAGIRDFHFHDLRHTFASHLVMAGVDITTVSRLLGHQTLTMTLRYSHLSKGHLDNAVNLLDRTLNENTISTKLAQFGR